MRKTIILKIAVCLFILIFIGCHSPTEPIIPIENSNPEITFVASGGFWGEMHKLYINSSGIAFNQTVYPNLELQLSKVTLDSILTLLKGFETYNDSYNHNAFDIFHYRITLRTSKKEKSVDIDEPSFENNQSLSLLAQAVGKFWNLEYRIYYEKSTWQGLQYEFSLGKTTYKDSDTILVLCRVSNPTTLQRVLYFRNNYHLQFGFSSVSYNPHIQSWVPDQAKAWGDTSSPNQIIFTPGETKDISFKWNQSFTNYSGESYTNLPEGNYNGVIYILAGPGPNGAYWSDYNIKFEIKN